MSCSTKDQMQTEHKSNIYKIVCYRCNKTYLRKTDRGYSIRIKKYRTRYDHPMHHYLNNCQGFHELIRLFMFLQLFSELPNVDFKDRIADTVSSHSEVTKTNTNLSLQCALVPLCIKKLSLSIHNDLKPLKELQLFQLFLGLFFF